ncbi:hypothetical protein bcgnr5372_46160 [Bacillus luti]|nr:hypothetical protein [Bacillus cereus]HDR8330548.1 hypothetical protein [Bacillus cereus]HDR8338118.1 hypothetical protein [Bacillus cereus]
MDQCYIEAANPECKRYLEKGQLHYFCIHESTLPEVLSKGFLHVGGFSHSINSVKHQYYYLVPRTYGTLYCPCGYNDLIRDVPLPYEPPSNEVMELNVNISLLQTIAYEIKCVSCGAAPEKIVIT